MHVQKDKRPALCPHYEKCVFIGYLGGYKGWKFYNPTTKRTVISEHADFDEHSCVATITPNTVPAVPYTAPDLPGNVDDDTPLAGPEMQPPQGERDAQDTEETAPLPPVPIPPATPPPAPARAPSPVGIGAQLPTRKSCLMNGGN